MTRKAGKPDTVKVCAFKIQKLIAVLRKLDLADSDDLTGENPRDMFARFMKRRIEKIKGQCE